MGESIYDPAVLEATQAVADGLDQLKYTILPTSNVRDVQPSETQPNVVFTYEDGVFIAHIHAMIPPPSGTRLANL